MTVTFGRWRLDGAKPVLVESSPPLYWHVRSRAHAPWNGQDFYASFGDGDRRSWEDAVRYGFVSAGGGRWYWRTLHALFVGARVFAYIPHAGYAGVGRVTETAQRLRDFTVPLDGRPVPIADAPLVEPGIVRDADDAEKTEYLVRVDWIKTLPREQAFWEKGLFANPNSAVRLRDPFTLERLSHAFGLAGAEGTAQSSAAPR